MDGPNALPSPRHINWSAAWSTWVTTWPWSRGVDLYNFGWALGHHNPELGPQCWARPLHRFNGGSEVAKTSRFLNGGVHRRRFLRTSSDINFTASVKIFTWSVWKFSSYIDFLTSPHADFVLNVWKHHKNQAFEQFANRNMQTHIMTCITKLLPLLVKILFVFYS